MIRVTCGHENGIGLEVFIRAYLCLPSRDQSQFTLYINNDVLNEYLVKIKKNFTPVKKNAGRILIDDCYLNIIHCNRECNPTVDSLKNALVEIDPKDILFTLPTSKDQFDHYLGYTDYLRDEFKIPYLPMTFLSPELNVVLLSDHWPLDEVTENLTPDLIFHKLKIAYEFFGEKKQYLVSGINPHAGEKGKIGQGDKKVGLAINQVKATFPAIKIKGPLAGDSMLTHHDKNNIYVFAFHDQGLAGFKSINRFVGVNITLGLPFKRISVDHGTSFDQLGNPYVNITGAITSMRYALDLLK
jgi:4-hydroxythreonine-4-phosphate dehydrogenase